MNSGLLALMPCPLKVPFEQKISLWLQAIKSQGDFDAEVVIVSNANQHLDFFGALAKGKHLEDLAEVMVAPGFNGFYHRDFMTQFKKTGHFVALNYKACNSSFKGMDFHDPEGHYTMLGFNPTVMLVDRTVHRELPIPESWADLLRPEYRGLVAMRGHGERNFCEGMMLNYYKEGGMAAVRALGAAILTGLHPSQMVKYAGSNRPAAPAVSAIPYSFARLVKANERVRLVWPKDGAIVNPLAMLVKRTASPAARRIAEYIAGPEIGQLFAGAEFPAVHPDVGNDLPEGAPLKWLGWDFIATHDLAELVPQLEQELIAAMHKEGS